MNILLWILQVVLAMYLSMGAVNQLFNYDKLKQQYVIYQALPQGFWVVYGTITLLCALGLFLTKAGRLITPIAALVLALESVLFVGVYAHFAQFSLSLLIWGGVPAIVAAFIAYARFSIKP